ncbi:uncharacterized protein DUF2812 [Pseudoduganella flava]|uniref:DUF2812 domain-containing protein n=1 Tax=Pseudoduganella flava TaxID=871742 RepID=A0A562PGA4_9BURK|nr:DUF2812 domain-containing protein [Pseudoduganella flava]QGZ40266.1 DUF2812 domain-containing protein [Pseudoduganella flava]TWI43449.1 uncharacterized protein DUF2812 [Pseudoduganella flava]
MNDKLVRKWNFTGPWNDERIERWLERLAAEGLHLESVGALGQYRFRRGAPGRVMYRIDVAMNRKKPDADYVQLMTDAGWRMAAEQGNLYYWRTSDPHAPEIFTDAASRAAKYERLARNYGLMLALSLLFFVKSAVVLYIDGTLSKTETFLAPLWTVLLAQTLYAYRRLRARIEAVRLAAAP